MPGGAHVRISSLSSSLFERGTESWTMLPIVPSFAVRAFSFSMARDSRSFFSDSRVAFLERRGVASSFAWLGGLVGFWLEGRSGVG